MTKTNSPVSTGPDQQPAIEITDLHHRFGKKWVLQEVNLQVPVGQSIALLGRSGSGKSTLLSCILGMIKPKRGGVKVVGTEVGRLSRRQMAQFRSDHIGMIFQNGELIDDLAADENVALPTLLSRREEHALERARELLATLQVPSDQIAHSLSGGEYQRTALARALLNQPEVILADEPTASLDPELRDEVAATLFAQAKQTGATLIVVTHDWEVAKRADRQLTLRDGRLVNYR